MKNNAPQLTLINFFTKLLIAFILMSCEPSEYNLSQEEIAIQVQGISFSFVGKKQNNENILLFKISGDIKLDSDLYNGGNIGIYLDEQCFTSASGLYSYDLSSSKINKEIEVTLREYKKYKLYLGVVKGKNTSMRFYKCMNKSLDYIHLPPIPTGFFLDKINKDNTLNISFTEIKNNISHVQFFSDSECENSISDKLDVVRSDGVLNPFMTNSLSFEKYKIYAKVWANEYFSSCSKDYLSYERTTASVSSFTRISSNDQSTIFRISGLNSGDQVQLYADSSCLTSISDKITSSENIINITTNILIPRNYFVFSKKWTSSNDASLCSSHTSTDISQISSRKKHTCSLNAAGEIKCWGKGNFGQLGNDNSSSTDHPVSVVDGDNSTTPLSGVVQVSAGDIHTCALITSGNVKCWGNNQYGKLGLRLNKGSSKDHPNTVMNGSNNTSLSDIIQISSGYYHTCALTNLGHVKCWGKGTDGQLGNDSNSTHSSPVNVVNADDSGIPLSGIIQISSGYSHTCALTNLGHIKCWGKGTDGQLGNSDTSSTDHPVSVVDGDNSTTPLSGIVQISSGGYHTCGLLASGNVKCWGYGEEGGLGYGGLSSKDHPNTVVNGNNSTTPLSNVVQISSGIGHTCALLASGSIKCWGYGEEGGLGYGGRSSKDHPVSVVDGDNSNTALTGMAQVSSGEDYTCALTTSGNIKCWGKGSDGQLGNDDTSDKNHPVDVVDGNNSSTLLQVGSRKARYNCNTGNCSFDITSSLIALDLQSPIKSPANDASPTIRVYHVQTADVVSLHANSNCTSAALASGTVAANSTFIDLTTSDLTDGQSNTIYAKVGGICSSNKIFYAYDSSTSN